MTLGRLQMCVLMGAAALLLALPSASAQGRGPGGRPGGGMPVGRPGFGGGHEGGRLNNAPANTPRMDGVSINSSTRSSIQLGPPGRWWDNAGLAHSVGLRRDQQQHMDSIFKANKAALLESYRTLEREQAKLAAISRQSQPDKAQLFAAIDSVNQARASLEKVNTQIKLQIRQQMDADQITRMEALSESQPVSH